MTNKGRLHLRGYALIALLLVAASCGGDGGDGDGATAPGEVGATPASASDIEGVSWKLTSFAISGADDLTAASQKSPATASFETGTVTGWTGCNNYNASYELGGDGKITFGEVSSTMAACPDLDAQVQAVLTGYEHARKAVIDDDALQLLDGDGNPLLFFDAASGA